MHDHSATLLDYVYRLGSPDREQLTALLDAHGYRADAVDQTLHRLRRRGFLSNSLRAAVDTRAAMGQARKRVIWQLTAQGKEWLGVPAPERTRLTKAAYERGVDHPRLFHDVLVSRVHCLALLGHMRGLYELRSERPTKVAVGKHYTTPDLVLDFITDKPYRRLFEIERRNQVGQTLFHARTYLEAFLQGHFDARVVFVTETRYHLEHVREKILNGLPEDPGTLFYFFSLDQFPLGEPERLMEPLLYTSGPQRTFVVPSRKAISSVG
jgi:hypothetical protein